MTMSNELALLTREEAAALIRVEPRTLDRAIARGEGPPILRIGKRVLIRRSDFDAWIEQSVRRVMPPGKRAAA
jgi:excisionase family DNA binding protein